jgi:hypothetical protein
MTAKLTASVYLSRDFMIHGPWVLHPSAIVWHAPSGSPILAESADLRRLA